MFTLSADSSPQTAPTTPSSVDSSNNSDEYLQPTSEDMWNNPYGTHGQVLSSGGLENAGDFVSGPTDFEMALGSGQGDICSLPLHDLIHDNAISNSPIAAMNTPNMVPLSTAWFNGLSPSSPTQNLLMSSLASLPSPPPSATMDTSALFMPPPQQQTQRQLQQSFAQQSITGQFAQGAMTMPPDAYMMKPQIPAGIRPPIQTTTNEHTISRKSSKLEASLMNNTRFSRWSLQVHDVPPKSRTETQVKLRVQLVEVSASLHADGSSGEPVTQYSHIQVPNTPSVKTKTRGVGDPDPSAVLSLQAHIFCATIPEYQNKPVPCCEACRRREQNRNSKKKTGAGTASVKGRSAASSKNVTPATSTNATPATSDAEMYSGTSGSHSHNHFAQRDGFEDVDGYVSPIDFTCNRLVDFSSGTASLSFRIVCYCRHYKEKTGFHVQLRLVDNTGRLVGEVKTTPIMIMDDHKSVSKLTPAHTADEDEVDNPANKRRAKRIVSRYSETESRIKEEDGDDFEERGVGAIRTKHRLSRHSVLSQSAGSLTKLTTSKPTSSSVAGPTISNVPSTSRSGSGHRHNHSQSYTHSESPLPTTAPSSPSVGFSPQPSHAMSDASAKQEAEVNAFAPSQPFGSSIPMSANDNILLPNPLMQTLPSVNMAMSGMTLSSPTAPMAPAPNPFPHITRIMPASGPVQGGIEITLLGANFTPEALANACIAFGENAVPFGPTVQIFSNSALICTLPPRSAPGPVEVKLLGVQEMIRPGMPSVAPIFTYTDEGDKDLMIHALQILGWQSSGQWQDPRSVAMGILGSGSSNAGMAGLTQTDTDMGFLGGFTFAAANRNGVNPHGLHHATQPGGRRNVEALVLNVLHSARNPDTGMINHLSAPHPVTGQTILHRACALGYQTLVSALIGWGANVDLTDKNGFTPVHFACFYGHIKCIDILVREGRAHLEGRDHQSRTPLDVCLTEAVVDVLRDLEEEVETRRRRSTAPSEIESGGEGDDEGLSWSEAEEEEEEDQDSEHSGSVYDPEPPQAASRRISRVNSVASIVSNRKLARSTTPFASEPFTMIHPLTPTHLSTSSASVPAPTRQPWWSMRGATATPRPEKQLPDNIGTSKAEQEQMFRWVREMWTVWRQQQQQQQQQQQLDREPPPSYTPADPVSKLYMAPQEKLVTGTVGTPAMPTELEEPPSPLSLDSQFEHMPTKTISRSTSNIRLRQQQIAYRRRVEREQLEGQPEMNLIHPGPRRAAKKQDTMLIYFWIPVLLVVFAWMSYKSVGLAYRSFLSSPLIRPSAAFVREAV